jgi:hypothetical protein
VESQRDPQEQGKQRTAKGLTKAGTKQVVLGLENGEKSSHSDINSTGGAKTKARCGAPVST